MRASSPLGHATVRPISTSSTKSLRAEDERSEVCETTEGATYVRAASRSARSLAVNSKNDLY